MLTVDFARLPIRPGTRLLDLGCGAGRHAFEAARRGARVVALDMDRKELDQVAAIAAAMDEAGEIPEGASIRTSSGDATAMPFDDGSFDVVIAAEVMEHIPTDQAAMHEVARVLRPGGVAAVTVPAWLPERVCWLLSDDYHNVPGGHVRIFTRRELEVKMARAGLVVGGHHHAHALHSPYWWLKCAVGVHDDAHPLASAYHKLLVWDIMKKPAVTRLADEALNPLIGKSLVVYATKPAVIRAPNPADTVLAGTVPADPVPAGTVPAGTVPADTVPADTVPADTGPADTGRPAAAAEGAHAAA
jgi:SAM-dependent methyltransferase